MRREVMVFNTTFNNISVILWKSVLLMEETKIHGRNLRPVTSHWQTLSHNRTQTHNLSGDGKSNYHTYTIMAMAAPHKMRRIRFHPELFFTMKWVTESSVEVEVYISHLCTKYHKKSYHIIFTSINIHW